MQSAKDRLDLVVGLANNGPTLLGSEVYAYECLSVQLRKVLELIAFGSLCANQEKYAEHYENFGKEWRAKRILDKLERIHPDFYPKPLRPFVKKPDGTKHFPIVEDGFLGREEFEELYDACSAAIHTANPFGSKTAINFRLPVVGWVDRIRTLLNIHLMHLAGTDTIWVVYMNGQDGKVQTFTAGPTEQQAGV